MDDEYLFDMPTLEGRPYLTIRLHDVPVRDSHVEITLHLDASRLRGTLDKDRWVLLDLIAERINNLRAAHRSEVAGGSGASVR
jgi:hypothetical protein